MASPAVIQKIKEVEIYTRRLMAGNLLGDKTSVLKGGGLEFDQLRDYQIGDDVRFIDWNSSARMNKVLVKQFYEERNRTIIIALDVSGSCYYGTDTLKYDAMAQVAAIIALVSEHAKDHVGIVLFSDTIHEYIAPRKGRKHTHLLLEKIFSAPTTTQKTDLNAAFEYLASLKKKNAVLFCISDFISAPFEKNLAVISRMYDCIAIRFNHRYEYEFPQVGLLTVHDIETGESAILDARSNGSLNSFLTGQRVAQDQIFKKYSVDLLSMSVETAPMPALIQFFKQRKR